MDNALISKVFEASIVGGSFLYLLTYVTRNLSSTVIANQKEIAGALKALGDSLHKVSETLLKIELENNMHFEQFEIRLRNLER